MENERGLRRWMATVAGFYLLLGLRLLPWPNDAMIRRLGVHSAYTGGDLTISTDAYRYVLDWMGTFGLDRIALGVLLLIALREPVRNRLFVHLVIAFEATAGVAADVWLLTRDYVNPSLYVVFIAVHLIVITTGLRVLRTRAPGPPGPAIGLERAASAQRWGN